MTLDETVALLQDWLRPMAGVQHTVADLKNLAEQAANDVAALTLSYEKRVVYRHTDSPALFYANQREYVINGTGGEGGLGILDSLKLSMESEVRTALQRLTARNDVRLARVVVIADPDHQTTNVQVVYLNLRVGTAQLRTVTLEA